MLLILIVHFSALLHRRHSFHTRVGFDHLRCLTHVSSTSVIGSPPITDPNTPLSLVLVCVEAYLIFIRFFFF